MKVTEKISLSVSAISAVGILSAGLLVWSVQRTHDMQQVIDVLNSRLSYYQTLNVEVFRTFKAVRKDMLSGSGEVTFEVAVAEKRIQDALSQIETTVTSEAILLSREPSASALGMVSLLRTELTTAFTDLRRAADNFAEGKSEQATLLTTQVLETTVDGVIADAIDRKVDILRIRLDALVGEVHQHHQNTILAGWVIGVGAVLIMVAGVWTLLGQVRRGLHTLADGADRFGQNDLSHRIVLASDDEFADLAHRMNAMASDLGDHQLDLEAAKADLEDRVQDRTQELAEANEKLEERDEMRRQFFADIGHELRTPVTAIRGHAEVALRARESRDSAMEDALRRIVSLSEQVTVDVSSLFFIAREQAGVLDLRLEPLDLRQLVIEALANLETTIAREGAVVTKHLPDRPVMVEAASKRMNQLIAILITNAITHSQFGVQIEITLRRKGSDVVLELADDGPGIPPTERARVFERFYRKARDIEEVTHSGIGLGLPIAKSLVKAQGGTIDLHDNSDFGTTVRVCFPLAEVGTAA